MSAEPTVFVVDDDAAVRESLTELLGAAGHAVRSYASAEAFLEDFRPGQPGCLLLDVRMPGLDGLGLQRELQRRAVTLPIILITGHGEAAVARSGFKMGALDFLEKPCDCAELIQLVEVALRRDAAARARAAGQAAAAARLARLSSREREVLESVLAGLRNKQIALRLGIAERTVEDHRANIMRVLGVMSVPELVRLAEIEARLVVAGAITGHVEDHD